MVTFTRVAPGEFHALHEGKDTGWRVYSGSHGFTGRNAANTYGFARVGGRPRWVGPLNSAKRLVIMAVSAEIGRNH